MTTKTYTLTTAFQAEAHVVVNGAGMDIRFTNGQFGPVRKNGYFTTSDPELQKALEESESYKKLYILTKTSETEVKKYKEPVKVEPVVESEETTVEDKEPVVEQETAGDTKSFPGVTNSQKAKAILLGLDKKLTHASLPNKESILAYAEQHNITFPDWVI